MTSSLPCPTKVNSRVLDIMPWACGTTRPGGTYQSLKGGRKYKRKGKSCKNKNMKIKSKSIKNHLKKHVKFIQDLILTSKTKKNGKKHKKHKKK